MDSSERCESPEREFYCLFPASPKEGIGKRLCFISPSSDRTSRKKELHSKGNRARGGDAGQFRHPTGRNRLAVEQRNVVRVGQRVKNFFYHCMLLKMALESISLVGLFYIAVVVEPCLIAEKFHEHGFASAFHLLVGFF